LGVGETLSTRLLLRRSRLLLPLLKNMTAGGVRNYWKKRLQGIVSPRSLDAYCQQVKECISIASKCLNKDRHQRPDIQKIILTLNKTETRIEKVSINMTRRYFFLENLFVKGVVFAMCLYIILLVSMEIKSNNNRPQLRSSTDTNQLCHEEWASSSGSSRFKQFDSSIHMLGSSHSIKGCVLFKTPKQKLEKKNDVWPTCNTAVPHLK